MLAGDVSTPLSYPENGSDSCFAVEDESFWFQHRNVVLRHLVQQFSPEGVFLDVGGGNGCVTKALQDAEVNAESSVAGFRSVWTPRQEFVVGRLTTITGLLSAAGSLPPLIEWVVVTSKASHNFIESCCYNLQS